MSTSSTSSSATSSVAESGYEARYYTPDDDCFEDPNDYCQGGHPPVHLGDHLNGRYRVAHKLGDGGYGTVWLCFDQTKKIWRAVKILSADQSESDECQELKATRALRSQFSLQELQDNSIVTALDEFTLVGPNGSHLCFVYPLLGCTLENVFDVYAPRQELLKDICFQLAKAMDFLHRNDICHGDFRPENIMFRLAKGVDRWSEAKLLKALGGKPNTFVVRSKKDVNEELPASVPKYLVDPVRFRWSSGLLSTSVSVSDFGVSFDPRSPPGSTSIPVKYRAPEDPMGTAPVGFSTDVWALINTIMEVRTGQSLSTNENETEETLLRKFELLMGPMPPNYRDVWQDTGGYFENGEEDPSLPTFHELEDYEYLLDSWERHGGERNILRRQLGSELNTRLLTQKDITDIVAQDYKTTGLMPTVREEPEDSQPELYIKFRLPAEEFEQLFDLCSSVFKWQPEERILTSEILNHPWFGDRNKKVDEPSKTPRVSRISKAIKQVSAWWDDCMGMNGSEE